MNKMFKLQNMNNFEYDNIHKRIFLSKFLYYDEKTNKPKYWYSGYIALIFLMIITSGLIGLGFSIIFYIIIPSLYYYFIIKDWNKNKNIYIKKINKLKQT